MRFAPVGRLHLVPRPLLRAQVHNSSPQMIRRVHGHPPRKVPCMRLFRFSGSGIAKRPRGHGPRSVTAERQADPRASTRCHRHTQQKRQHRALRQHLDPAPLSRPILLRACRTRSPEHYRISVPRGGGSGFRVPAIVKRARPGAKGWSAGGGHGGTGGVGADAVHTAGAGHH